MMQACLLSMDYIVLQKTELFINTVVKTSNPTRFRMFISQVAADSHNPVMTEYSN
jgi:hypothetical protein